MDVYVHAYISTYKHTYIRACIDTTYLPVCILYEQTYIRTYASLSLSPSLSLSLCVPECV